MSNIESDTYEVLNKSVEWMDINDRTKRAGIRFM
jgi:hypothetical protein